MSNNYSSLFLPWSRYGLGALALVASVANTAQAQTATFAAAATYRTGDTPQGIAFADVNGDGRPDVINVNSSSGNVGILLNSSTAPGSFPATATFYSSRGSFPIGLGVGDVNNDGRPDVVVANMSSGTVGVLLNSPAAPGTFLAGTLYDTGFSPNFDTPRGIALGDVNGDGRLDIVVGNQSASTVSVLLNSATSPGTFSAAKLYPTSAPSDALALGDVDGDGRLDIVASSTSSGISSISVLLNSATTPGTFLPVAPYKSGISPRGVTLGDVNGDGRLDIVTANEGSSDVGVFLNSSTTPGTFSAVTLYPSGAAGPSSVMVADLTGDGRLDIATANYNSSRGNTVSVLVNSAASPGTFLSATTYSSGGEGPHDIALADVNGDGKPDIATTNLASGTVGVLRNTTLPVPTLTSLNPTRGPIGTTVVLTGTNLGNATTVSFNGQAVTFTVNSATTITATVPLGATTGNVTVTTASGTTSGLLFTVTYPDLVVSTPTTIPAGTYNSITVTSTGAGTLAGDVTVNTSLTVQSGGSFSDGCAVISGAGSFTLAEGATLNICAAQGISSSGATGAVQVTGSRFFSPSASYVYNGTTAQLTGDALPTQVRNLTITNPNDVTLSQGVAIVQVLTIGDRGDLVQPSAAASVTLLSNTTTGTALMVNKYSGVLQGPTTTIQRAIDGSTNTGFGYRHFAPPVYGATIGSLTTTGFTPVVNSLYNTQGGSVQPFPTVYFYEESRVNDPSVPGSGFDKGWVSPDDLTDQLFNAKGYTLQLPATAKLSVTGRVFDNGGIGYYVSRTGSDAAAGWSLVGNPYPSPIDWSLVDISDRAGLDAAMYVFESTGPYTGSYRSYANGIGGNPIIPLGQAFFVRVSSGQTQGLMFFKGSQRVTTFNATSFKRTTADLRPQLALSLTGATLHDITYLYQETGATTGVDAEYDAVKMPNSNGLNVSQVATTTRLAINGLPTLTAATSVPLVVGVPAAGTYTLSPTTLSNLPTGLDAYLRDAQTGQTVKLAAGSSYSFDITATQAATPVLGRFTLQFTLATPLATTPALAPELVGIYPNPAHGSFTVTVPAVAGATQVQAELVNALGQVVRQHSAALPASGASFNILTTELAAGVYVLRLQTGDTTLAKRVVVQ